MLTLQWWSVNLQMSLKVLQINLHHCKAASAALLLRLAGGGADVVLIQEPWMVCGRGPNPGTLDGVRNEDNTTVSLELQLAPIRLLSAYMAYDQVGPLPDDFTRDLIRDTFIIKDRKEVIDLTLVSHSIGNLITEGKVLSEHSFSDHRYIEFVLNLKQPEPSRLTNLRKTDWTRYKALLNKYIPEHTPEGPHSIVRLHKLIKTFTTACISAAFLEIEGAFNNVFPDAITGALTGLGIDGRLVGLINQLLTSRAVTSTLGSSTLTREEWAVKPPGKPGALTLYTDGSKLKNHNIPGNSIADELARKGTTKLLLPDKEDTSMPLATSKLLLHNQSNHKNTLRGLSAIPPRKIALFIQSSNWTPF
ncbi:hypothetical protein ACLKA7_007723 [Drosophila subpalustris]